MTTPADRVQALIEQTDQLLDTLDLAANAFGLTADDILGRDRHRPRPLARAAAISLLVRWHRLTITDTATFLGLTYSTTSYHLRRLPHLRRHNPTLNQIISRLEKTIALSLGET